VCVCVCVCVPTLQMIKNFLRTLIDCTQSIKKYSCTIITRHLIFFYCRPKSDASCSWPGDSLLPYVCCERGGSEFAQIRVCECSMRTCKCDLIETILSYLRVWVRVFRGCFAIRIRTDVLRNKFNLGTLCIRVTVEGLDVSLHCTLLNSAKLISFLTKLNVPPLLQIADDIALGRCEEASPSFTEGVRIMLEAMRLFRSTLSLARARAHTHTHTHTPAHNHMDRANNDTHKISTSEFTQAHTKTEELRERPARTHSAHTHTHTHNNNNLAPTVRLR
jgi:hypothetical protein